jgi:hypothetical protein
MEKSTRKRNRNKPLGVEVDKDRINRDLAQAEKTLGDLLKKEATAFSDLSEAFTAVRSKRATTAFAAYSVYRSGLAEAARLHRAAMRTVRAIDAWTMDVDTTQKAHGGSKTGSKQSAIQKQKHGGKAIADLRPRIAAIWQKMASPNAQAVARKLVEREKNAGYSARRIAEYIRKNPI